MKLSEIMKRVCDTGDLDFEVSCVTADSRQIVKDCVFICIKGKNLTAMIMQKRQLRQVRALSLSSMM